VVCCAPRPNGGLASGGQDGKVILWRGDGSTEHVCTGHKHAVSCVLGVDAARVASGGEDCNVMVWSTVSGKRKLLLKGHTDEVLCLSLLERRLASSSKDATVRIWTLDGQAIQVLRGHSDVVGIICTVGLCNEASRVLVSGSCGGDVRVWSPEHIAPGSTLICSNTATGHTGRVLAMVALSDGRMITGSDDNTLMVWSCDCSSAQIVFIGHTQRATCIAEGPQRMVASGGYDHTIRLWEVLDEAHVASSMSGDQPMERQSMLWMRGHTDCITGVAWLADGRLISASDDRTLRVWKISGAFHSCEQVLHGHSLGVSGLQVLPDEHGRDRVVSMSRDSTLRLWT